MGKQVPKGKAKAKGKAAHQSVSDSKDYIHFRAFDWTPVESDSECQLGSINGHCLVAAGHRLWCLGGDRGTPTSTKISLLGMDLRKMTWEDHTPSAGSYAPSWRWGHSNCLLPARFPPRRGRAKKEVLLMCGGFDSKDNLQDAWHFCPNKGKFFIPNSGLQHVPMPGGYHSLAYDDCHDRVYLFGGQCCVGGPYSFFDHLYMHDLLLPYWKLTPTKGKGPGPRAQHSAVITDGVMIVYGGTNGVRSFRDVWTLHLRCPAPVWREVRIEGPPLFVGTRARQQPFQVIGNLKLPTCLVFQPSTMVYQDQPNVLKPSHQNSLPPRGPTSPVLPHGQQR